MRNVLRAAVLPATCSCHVLGPCARTGAGACCEHVARRTLHVARLGALFAGGLLNQSDQALKGRIVVQ